ncbi:MAG: hypothetical protein AAF493_07450 [Pseudomonadota bacterium]
MGYDDRDRERGTMRGMIVDDTPETAADRFRSWLAVGAAVLGVVVLVVGVFFGLKVLTEAWALYQEPERILRIARAVEAGSHVDQALQSSVPGAEVGEGVKVSYLLAWFVACALMFVCGALSFWAITAGGGLALHGFGRKRDRKKP